MINDPEFRKSLLISLATSVLVLIFIDPVLKTALKWVMWGGTHVSESWTNSIYKSAALGSTQKFSFMMLALAFSTVQGGIVGLLLVRFTRWRKAQQTSLPKKVPRFAGFAFYSLAPLVYILGLLILADSFADLQLNTSFNQRLTVLAAKVSDQEIKELRADWALMESRNDYLKVDARMKRLAETTSTRLPPWLW